MDLPFLDVAKPDGDSFADHVEHNFGIQSLLTVDRQMITPKHTPSEYCLGNRVTSYACAA